MIGRRTATTLVLTAVLLTWGLLAHAAPGAIEVHVAGPAAVAVVSGDDLVASGSVAKGARGCLIKGVAPGAYNIVASASGYASASKSVTVPDGGEAEAWFELKKLAGDDYKALGRVVGFVKSAAGKPMAGATLLLLSGDTVVGTAKSMGDKGVYELEWYKPGTYTVVCMADGCKRAVFTGQKVTAGKSTRLDIELQPE